MSTEKKGIEASFKSMDTEEFLDIYFNRPVGYAWALFFKKLGLNFLIPKNDDLSIIRKHRQIVHIS